MTAEEMRRLEAGAEAAGIPPARLMENAGLAVARAVRQRMGGAAERRVIVLVGPGNNGGDGLVAGRHLHRWGAQLVHYLCAQRRTPDPHLAAALNLGIETLSAEEDSGLVRLVEGLEGADVVVDAVLGTGRARPIEEPLKGVLEATRAAKARRPALTIVALDLPTGLGCDVGAADPAALAADATLTLGHPKSGLFLGSGSSLAGQVQCLDIGIPPDLEEDAQRQLITTEMVGGLLPRRPADSNKGTYGRVLVVAGSRSFPGAAVLACAGAGRIGAGLVTLAAPASLQPILAPQMPEATHIPLQEGPQPGVLDPVAVVELQQAQGYSAYLIGCGVGQPPATAAVLRGALLEVDGPRLAPLVLDADALNVLAVVEEWWRSLPFPVVVTPHPGEMARLTNLTVSQVQEDRLGVAERAAREWGVTVVLKGAHTVVAEPEGRIRLSPWAVPALASAGTGDVLAGAVAGLLAQRLDPFDAATCAVYLHGLAGHMVSREVGDSGLLASDLLPAMSWAIKAAKAGD